MIKAIMASAWLFVAVGASPAMAEPWTPASEIVGQAIEVNSGGIVNKVVLDLGGYARIVSPGGRTVMASWTANGQRLCLNAGGSVECWPYVRAFEAGRPVTLTSDCNATSTWTVNAVNPPPRVENMGERG